MTRKLCAMTLALAVGGGVYLTAQPAAASNMGFKLEREFAFVGEPGFDNLFYVSFPLFNGLGDIADTTIGNAGGNPCTGTGDGVVNADDLICDLWTDQLGTFTVTRYDIATCSFEGRSGLPSFTPGEINVTGLWTDPLPADEGFRIEQTEPMGAGTPRNQAVIVGSHDPSYAGRTIRGNPACRGDRQYQWINLPYHTMYTSAAEIACGLRGVDWDYDAVAEVPIWLDLDGNTTVDMDEECGGGVFDGTHNLTVRWYDNVDDNGGPTGRDTDGEEVGCSVVRGFTTVDFVGDCVNFELSPGEAYIVAVDRLHDPTTFLSPHF